jgi:hypothetical protein
MILTTETGGRTKSHGKYLIAHLAKTENVEAVIAEIGNCQAETLGEFVAIVEIYRNASLRATARSPAFHHSTVNPSKDHFREKLIETAHRVRRELDPAGTRPYALVIHRKARAEPRSEPGGSSSEHLHLLIGAVDEHGKFLDDGWSKIKTERLCLELAYDLGEPAVVGRHFQSALRVLTRTRPEVVQWLENTVGLKRLKRSASRRSRSRNVTALVVISSLSSHRFRSSGAT